MDNGKNNFEKDSFEKNGFWIEFIGDRSIKIAEGQSILQASLAAGIPHYHDCGGNAKCSTCRVLVKEGSSYLTPYNEKETLLRATIPLPVDVRLACQTYVTGSPVKVHRIIRDESDIAIYTEDQDVTHQMGEERELALFFLDIRNFTPFIESYLPFDVIHILRRLFLLFRKSIEENQGTIIETSGDGLYAVFGFGSSIDQAANEGLNAGMNILKELELFNAQYLNEFFNHQFDVGIGLHVGRVITGNVGLGVNNNLTVMGLPVNIASRLQTATRELNNSFIISENVARLVKRPVMAPTAHVYLKGIKDPFMVYLVGSEFKTRIAW